MAGEISSDMPGTEEFAGMEMDEIGDQLPQQGAPGESNQRQSSEGGQGADKPAANAGNAQGAQAAAAPQLEPGAQDTVKTLEAKLTAVEKALQTMGRENRSYQALASKLARLENALTAKESQASAKTLTPEQQTEAAQRQEAEKFLENFVETFVEKKYGELVQPLRLNSIKSSVEQRCAELGHSFEDLNPFLGKVINDDIALANEGDMAARSRIDRILNQGDSTELMLRAISERSRSIQEQGAQVQQKQQQAANKGGRAVKPNGTKPSQDSSSSLSDVENMSDEDRERLYDKDPLAFEKLIPKQRR